MVSLEKYVRNCRKIDLMVIRSDEIRRCGEMCDVSKGIPEITVKEYKVLEKW